MALCTQDQIHLQNLKTYIKESQNDLIIKEVGCWDDETFMMFIRCRKYNIKSAFNRIQNLTEAMRLKYPEVFSDIHPQRLYVENQYRVVDVLKHRDSKGKQIYIFRFCYWDPSKQTVDDAMKCIFLVIFQMLESEETQKNGCTIIIDAENFSLRHASQITLSKVRKYSSIIVNGNPLKLKEIHVVNSPSIFNMTLKLLKMFLSKKLKDRVCIHGTPKPSLHEWISPEILPPWLGGNLIEEEAIDHLLIPAMCTDARQNYYKNFFKN